MQGLKDEGLSVDEFFDLGCGSGILSISACKFWPTSRGAAADIESLAISATTDNLANNQCGGRVECTLGSSEHMRGPYPLVLANIQAPILCDLAEAICRAVAPGGHLLLSGILNGQVPTIAKAYANRGLELGTVSVDGDWSLVPMHRPSA